MLASLRKAVVFVLAVLLLPSVAVAQLNRTAVSVTGNDAASCAVPDPCRTFAVALSRTNPNGEVVALTSGGYGPFILNKPATIVAAPGIYAALVATAGNAILVDAGASANVVIRGLHLYGMGTGSTGIFVSGLSAKVHVEHCVIDGFQSLGIYASQNTVRVSDTTIRRCLEGIRVDNGGKGTINRVEVRDGINGVSSQTGSNVTVRDSVVADCSSGFDAVQGELNIENSLATNNVNGVRANTSTVRVSNTMVTDNSIGFLNVGGSIFVSWGNNKVRGNGTDKSGTITVVTQD